MKHIRLAPSASNKTEVVMYTASCVSAKQSENSSTNPDYMIQLMHCSSERQKYYGKESSNDINDDGISR